MEFWSRLGDALMGFIDGTGITWIVKNFMGDTQAWRNVFMIIVALILMYLAIKKEYEPLLLLPISFGMLLVNLPLSGVMNEPVGDQIGGLLHYLYQGDELGIFPPLIFMGVGVMTDFGPLLANPKSFLLGAAAQFGIFFAFFGALVLGFSPNEAASIGIIGGADGPTAIFTTIQLAPDLLGPIAVAAYSYMSLVPIIQPPIMKALTTKEERVIKMEQLRPVSHLEKVLFPIVVTIVIILILPSTAPLIGMLMFGNLIKVSGVTEKLAETASNALMYIITIFLGITVGATASAEKFLTVATIKILLLGLAAFAIGTAMGVVFGKIMCKLSGGKINPLIGAAGVSAVPMAARVVQKVGQKENPTNFLLMHAMGPNVAGVIGSAVAAGVFLTLYK
ncbi:putative methylmalonyl-CoA decarboxylase, beta-subunit [Vallitalea longa]|uniref:Methylmalonyl-CoA decarboxylase, beta-subunit n=2 Tax=Vallitalea longa TaxID=2936439 RepID=A0A9W5YCP3_9FIRM|nr:putative methylmalonyl-CoA decarboxylase, beta-subunit [Vallitalea longa]